MTKDLFRILVIVSANVINFEILVSIWTMETVNAEKKLVDNLVEEYTENIEKTGLVEKNFS